MGEVSRYDRQWHDGVPRSGRVPTLAGFGILVVTVCGFGAWASTAPIDGAIVANGSFVATSQNKILQHLEGGIISEILVNEGELVNKGDTLMRLDKTAPRASLRRLELRKYELMAVEARLNAEARQRETIAFPPKLREAGRDSKVREMLEQQSSIYQARRARFLSELAIIDKSIRSLRERIPGAKAQIDALGHRMEFLGEELAGKTRLYEKGLLAKPVILALKRRRASLEGERGRLNSEIGDNRERIAKLEREIQHRKDTAVQSAVEELHQTRAELNDVRERITSARDVLKRVEIKAPVSGVVVKMNYHTPGGVIEPGVDILEMLPADDELLIEAHVRPQDIDNVKTGQDAIVRLTALSQRVTPMVPGEVAYVSADVLPDEQKITRNSVYVARIRLDAAKAAQIKNFRPTPGMPAEIFIRTGERTFFEYLMQPIADTMTRAFREQ